MTRVVVRIFFPIVVSYVAAKPNRTVTQPTADICRGWTGRNGNTLATAESLRNHTSAAIVVWDACIQQRDC